MPDIPTFANLYSIPTPPAGENCTGCRKPSQSVLTSISWAAEPLPVGAARARRDRRRARGGRRFCLLRLGVALGALFMILAAVLVPGRDSTPGQAAAIHTMTPTPTSQPSPTSTATQALASSPTPAPSVTATRTPTPTATLNPEEVRATAWQAQFEQAAATSHAVQTLNVQNLSATQTTLPPTVTAKKTSMAATASAATATTNALWGLP